MYFERYIFNSRDNLKATPHNLHDYKIRVTIF